MMDGADRMKARGSRVIYNPNLGQGLVNEESQEEDETPKMTNIKQ